MKVLPASVDRGADCDSDVPPSQPSSSSATPGGNASSSFASRPAPLLPDAAYMGLVLPIPGDVGAGRLANDDDALPPGVTDDEEGWDGGT